MFEGDNERRGADDSPKVLVTKGVVLWKRGLIYVGRTIKKRILYNMIYNLISCLELMMCTFFLWTHVVTNFLAKLWQLSIKFCLAYSVNLVLFMRLKNFPLSFKNKALQMQDLAKMISLSNADFH